MKSYNGQHVLISDNLTIYESVTIGLVSCDGSPKIKNNINLEICYMTSKNTFKNLF